MSIFRHIAQVPVNDMLSYEYRLVQGAHLECTSLHTVVDCPCKYRHRVRSCVGAQRGAY